MADQNSRKRGPHGGGSLADDRGQLLDEQRAKIARDRQRPRPSSTAIAERVERDRVALGLEGRAVAEVSRGRGHFRPLTSRECQDQVERAPITWLATPVMIGRHGRLPVVGYTDPPGAPKWLAEVLDAAA